MTTPAATTTTADPAMVERREKAEARFQELLATFERAGIVPNVSHIVARSMGMILSRLVSAGMLQAEEVKAELAENEYRLLKPMFARALQQQEEESLTGKDGKPVRKQVKRHDAARQDPEAFTSPALLRRERGRERQTTVTRGRASRPVGKQG